MKNFDDRCLRCAFKDCVFDSVEKCIQATEDETTLSTGSKSKKRFNKVEYDKEYKLKNKEKLADYNRQYYLKKQGPIR